MKVNDLLCWDLYDEINARAFGNQLPTCLTECKPTPIYESWLGRCRYEYKSKIFHIYISTSYDMTYDDLMETMAHEMIHAWVNIMGYGRESDHGAVFMKKAQQVNAILGTKIGQYHSRHVERIK